MIDPKLLRTDPEAVARNLARRGFTLDVAALQALEDRRKPWQVELDRLRAERNANAKAVGMAKGRGEDAAAADRQGREPERRAGTGRARPERGAGRSSSSGSSDCRTCCTSRSRTGATRAPTSRCAAGASRARFAFTPRDHVTIGEHLGGLDFEAAARISGAASW